MGDSSRRVPTSALVVVALALLASGATWWVGAEPSAAVAVADPRAPVSSVIVLRLDDGRTLTYESGRTVVSESSVPRRRCQLGRRVSPAPRSGVDSVTSGRLITCR